MTAPHIVDPVGLLGEALAEASPDLMRSLLQTVINALLSADVDAVVGAEWGKQSPGRLAQRNGYRHRDLDTRVGTVDVAIPKPRSTDELLSWWLSAAERRGWGEGAQGPPVWPALPLGFLVVGAGRKGQIGAVARPGVRAS